MRPDSIFLAAAILLLLILSAASPAAARCCSIGGGGASYDFLGDSAMSLDMDSYDEFLRDYGGVSEQAGREKSAAPANESGQSRLTIRLNDSIENAKIDLLLSSGEEGISGAGNMTSSRGSEAVSAQGSMQGRNLTLNVTSPSGYRYAFSLAGEGSESRLLGRFTRCSQSEPEQAGLNGTAWGNWEQ